MTPSNSRILRILGRTYRAAFYVLLVLIVAFLALTRTDIGRDGLRQQLQAQFNAQFEGSLDIGTLSGTLLYDFYAHDVTLRTPDGKVVVSIDSVAARPRWTALWERRLSLRSLTLIRPHVIAHRAADSSWTIQGALRPIRPPTGDDRGSFNIRVDEVNVQNGRITTRNDAPLPSIVRDGWSFNYLDTEATNVTMTAGVAWTNTDRRLSVERASFALPEPDMDLRNLSGTATRTEGQWRIEDVRLDATAASLALDATVTPTAAHPTLDIDVHESRIDFASLRRLMPRLPLVSRATARASVYGTLSEFVIERLQVQSGQSRLGVTGTIIGWPDSLDVDARVQKSNIHAADVHALWPEAPSKRLDALQEVTVDAFVRGTAHWKASDTPHVQFSSSFEAVSPTAGAIAGRLRTARTSNRRLRYTLQATTDSLNLAPLTLRPALSSHLNGSVWIAGQGIRPATRALDARIALDASRIRTQQVDSLEADLFLTGRQLEGALQVRQASGGRLTGTLDVDGTGRQPSYRLEAQTSALNLRGIAETLPRTQVNSQLRVDGQGTSMRSLVGTAEVALDSSIVIREGDWMLLPPHQAQLTVRSPDAEEPRLQLNGSVLQLTIDGDLAPQLLVDSGRLWRDALQTAVARAANKPRPGTHNPPDTVTTVAGVSSPPRETSSTASSTAWNRLRQTARDGFAAAGRDRPLQTSVSLQVLRSGILRTWWPAVPQTPEGLQADLHWTVGPDTLNLAASIQSTAIRTPSVQADGVAFTFDGGGALTAPLADTWTTDLSLQADTLRASRLSLRKVSVDATYNKRQGALRIEGRGTDLVRAFRVDTDVRVRPDRNDLTIRDAQVAVRDQLWQIAHPGTLTLYRRAAVIDSLVVESGRSFSDAVQRLRVQGTLSASPDDTVAVGLEGVSLYPIIQAAGIQRSIGGRIDGRVALLGGLAAPRLQTDVTVRRLSFDRRLLGRLRLTTRYVPQDADVEMNARLDSEPLPLDSLQAQYDPLVPIPVRRAEPNALRLDGRLRLPRPEAPNRELLDLNLSVERADLFFFEYIFAQQIERVSGYTTGTATITGSLTDPTFNADMTVQNGRFSLPRFGLTYGIEGDVDVDREGIHMREVTVAHDDGQAALDGSLLFNEYRYFSFDLRGRLDELLIIDVADSDDLPFYGSIRASGDATLTGPLSNATLRSNNATTTPDSELYIPVSDTEVTEEAGFIIFADSTGALPNLRDITRRENILADRPEGQPSFIEGLEIDINVSAPPQSTVHLVFDPLVGDVVTARGTGRIQLQRLEGDFFVYGRFDVSSGTYLFTAGEVFVRRFSIEEGTLTWDGNPTNARIDLQAAYRTRASTDGLPGLEDQMRRIPVVVQLDIRGFVETPRVDLSLSTTQDQGATLVGTPTLDAILNQPELATEYATSVLLTNTFLLTTSSASSSGAQGGDDRLASAGNQLAFNSVSQLVASQLNRYLNEALPNVDLNLGVQGEDTEDLDIIYGVALRLLNERLIIRGEGVYTSDTPEQRQAQGPQGEVVVEVRLSQRVSAEVFYRRTGDDLTRGQTLTSSAGAGLTYQTEFSTWKRLFYRVFGWLLPDPEPPAPEADEEEDEALASPSPPQ